MEIDNLKKIEFHTKVINYYENLYAQGKITKGTLDVQTQDNREILKMLQNK